MGPLAGVRVLDLTRVLSGPHATRMLADLGAEVIKLEPPEGDLTRFSSPRVGSMATYFLQQNAGKSSLSLDLSQPEGADLFRDLVAQCDVLVENFRPGVMDRLGLGFEALAAVAPRLIYASISGYGATGPWRHRRAYAPVIGAESGMTRAQADAWGGEVVNDPHSHADVYTAMETATAILAALYQREQTGRGQWIDVSMAESLLYVNEHVHDLLYDGAVNPAWIRSFQPHQYPVLTVADGTTMVVSGHPAERGTFDRFIAAMERSDLASDPRFVDVPARLTHLDDLMTLMRAWAAALPDAHTLETRLDAHGLAAGVVRSVREMADTSWAASRGAIVEVDDRRGGTIRVPAPPWHFSDATVGNHTGPRFRGEDNHQILRDMLGVDDDRLADLEARGVLSQRLPDSRT
jgi:CoA:oxalate CoA-transferase